MEALPLTDSDTLGEIEALELIDSETLGEIEALLLVDSDRLGETDADADRELDRLALRDSSAGCVKPAKMSSWIGRHSSWSCVPVGRPSENIRIIWTRESAAAMFAGMT